MNRVPPRMNALGIDLQRAEAEIGSTPDGWHSMGRYYYGWAIRRAYLEGAMFVALHPEIAEDAKSGTLYLNPEEVRAMFEQEAREIREHAKALEDAARDVEMRNRARTTKQFDHSQRGWPAVRRVHLIGPAKWRLTRWSKFKMWVSSLAYKLSVWWERVKNPKLVYDAEHDTWLGDSDAGSKRHTPRMSDVIVHTAGEPNGLEQRCSRCGITLQNYNNKLSVGDWSPVWWSGNVAMGTGYTVTTEEPANCTPMLVRTDSPATFEG